MERCGKGSRHAQDLSPVTEKDEILSRTYHSPVQPGLQLSVAFPHVPALQNPAQALCNPTAAYGMVQGVSQGSRWPSPIDSETSIHLPGLAGSLPHACPGAFVLGVAGRVMDSRRRSWHRPLRRSI